MRTALFISIIYLNCFLINAQISFQKLIDGDSLRTIGCDIKQTSDGGNIILGYSNSYGAGNSDILLIKTLASGDTVWTRTYGDADIDVGESVSETSDGGFIITGYSYENITLTDDIILIKVNSNGDLIWSKSYHLYDYYQYGNSVIQTIDGGYLINGSLVTPDGSDFATIIIKTDSLGNSQWDRVIFSGYPDGNCMSGNGIQDSDGNYLITGTSSCPATGSDAFLLKLSQDGSTIWSKKYGTVIGAESTNFIHPTSDRNYILFGNLYDCSSTHKYFLIIKVNPNGDTLWSKIYRLGDLNEGYQIIETKDNGFLCVGGAEYMNYSEICMFKIDSIGNFCWAKTYDVPSVTSYNETVGNSAAGSQDGGAYIIGTITDHFEGLKHRIYFIKTDSLGNSGCDETNHIASPISLNKFVVDFTFPISSALIENSPILYTASGSHIITLCFNQSMDNDLKFDIINLHPNPASNEISFESPSNANHVEIININGQVVYKSEIENSTTTTIDISSLSNGIYIFMIYSTNEIYYKKFIKQ